jgi:aminoglycoside phosphotransferase
MAPTPHPHPLAPESTSPLESETAPLLRELDDVRRKLRAANRERGATALRLHMTRLELAKARQGSRKAETELEGQASYARRLYYMLREVMEIVRPGMTHGEMDDDYKYTLAELRRLHGNDVVAQLDMENTAILPEGGLGE